MNTGIALVEAVDGQITVLGLGLIVTAASDGVRKNYDDFDRAFCLRDALAPWVAQADVVCVEPPQVGGAATSSRSMWSSGITLGALVLIDKPMVCLTPKQVKEVTGKATASKEEMCAWAYGVRPGAAWPSRRLKGADVRLVSDYHIADALAAVYAGLRRGWK